MHRWHYIRTLFLARALLMAFVATARAESTSILSPLDLRCEYSREATGVDVANPRLSWKVESTSRGARQTAYQVLVATSRERLAQHQGDLWDSGKVPSDATLHIR